MLANFIVMETVTLTCQKCITHHQLVNTCPVIVKLIFLQVLKNNKFAILILFYGVLSMLLLSKVSINDDMIYVLYYLIVTVLHKHVIYVCSSKTISEVHLTIVL